jgi:hypothetical protein
MSELDEQGRRPDARPGADGGPPLFWRLDGGWSTSKKGAARAADFEALAAWRVANPAMRLRLPQECHPGDCRVEGVDVRQISAEQMEAALEKDGAERDSVPVVFAIALMFGIALLAWPDLPARIGLRGAISGQPLWALAFPASGGLRAIYGLLMGAFILIGCAAALTTLDCASWARWRLRSIWAVRVLGRAKRAERLAMGLVRARLAESPDFVWRAVSPRGERKGSAMRRREWLLASLSGLLSAQQAEALAQAWGVRAWRLGALRWFFPDEFRGAGSPARGGGPAQISVQIPGSTLSRARGALDPGVAFGAARRAAKERFARQEFKAALMAARSKTGDVEGARTAIRWGLRRELRIKRRGARLDFKLRLSAWLSERAQGLADARALAWHESLPKQGRAGIALALLLGPCVAGAAPIGLALALNLACLGGLRADGAVGLTTNLGAVACALASVAAFFAAIVAAMEIKDFSWREQLQGLAESWQVDPDAASGGAAQALAQMERAKRPKRFAWIERAQLRAAATLGGPIAQKGEGAEERTPSPRRL